MSVHPAQTPEDLDWSVGEDGKERASYTLYAGEYGCDFTRPFTGADGGLYYSTLAGPLRVLLVRTKPGAPIRFFQDREPRVSRGLGRSLVEPWMDSDNIADVDKEAA